MATHATAKSPISISIRLLLLLPRRAKRSVHQRFNAEKNLFAGINFILYISSAMKHPLQNSVACAKRRGRTLGHRGSARHAPSTRFAPADPFPTLRREIRVYPTQSDSRMPFSRTTHHVRPYWRPFAFIRGSAQQNRTKMRNLNDPTSANQPLAPTISGHSSGFCIIPALYASVASSSACATRFRSIRTNSLGISGRFAPDIFHPQRTHHSQFTTRNCLRLWLL